MSINADKIDTFLRRVDPTYVMEMDGRKAVGIDAPDETPINPKGTNIFITDGDSGYTLNEDGSRTTFRLAGFDAPETEHSGGATAGRYGEPGGQAAKRYLAKLIEEHGASPVSTGEKDFYGRGDITRLVGRDGTDLSDIMARSGLVNQAKFTSEPGRNADNQMASILRTMTPLGDTLTGDEKVVNDQAKAVHSQASQLRKEGLLDDPLIHTNPDRNSAERKAWTRGLEGTKESLNMFKATVGDVIGDDEMKASGIADAEKNRDVAALYPSKVPTFDDVHSVGQFGQYALEKVLENAPVLAATAATAVATDGSSLALQAGARAAGLGRTASVLSKVGTSEGAAAGMYAQNVGDTANQLHEAGVEDFGAASLVEGVPKTALDFVSLGTVLGAAKKAAKDVRLGADTIKHLGVASGTEGATEGLQQVLDNATVSHYTGEDLWSEENIKSVKESVIAGAIVGGSIAGIGTAPSAYRTGRDAIFQKSGVADATPTPAPETETPVTQAPDSTGHNVTSREPAKDIDAQLGAVRAGRKHSHYLSSENADSYAKQREAMPGATIIETEEGQLGTYRPIDEAAYRSADPETREKIKAEHLYTGEAKENIDPETAVGVETRTPDGAVVTQQLTNNVEAAVAHQESLAAPDEHVVVTHPVESMQRRIAAVEQEKAESPITVQEIEQPIETEPEHAQVPDVAGPDAPDAGGRGASPDAGPVADGAGPVAESAPADRAAGPRVDIRRMDGTELARTFERVKSDPALQSAVAGYVAQGHSHGDALSFALADERVAAPEQAGSASSGNLELDAAPTQDAFGDNLDEAEFGEQPEAGQLTENTVYGEQDIDSPENVVNRATKPTFGPLLQLHKEAFSSQYPTWELEEVPAGLSKGRKPQFMLEARRRVFATMEEAQAEAERLQTLPYAGDVFLPTQSDEGIIITRHRLNGALSDGKSLTASWVHQSLPKIKVQASGAIQGATTLEARISKLPATATKIRAQLESQHAYNANRLIAMTAPDGTRLRLHAPTITDLGRKLVGDLGTQMSNSEYLFVAFKAGMSALSSAGYTYLEGQGPVTTNGRASMFPPLLDIAPSSKPLYVGDILQAQQKADAATKSIARIRQAIYKLKSEERHFVGLHSTSAPGSKAESEAERRLHQIQAGIARMDSSLANALDELSNFTPRKDTEVRDRGSRRQLDPMGKTKYDSTRDISDARTGPREHIVRGGEEEDATYRYDFVHDYADNDVYGFTQANKEFTAKKRTHNEDTNQSLTENSGVSTRAPNESPEKIHLFKMDAAYQAAQIELRSAQAALEPLMTIPQDKAQARLNKTRVKRAMARVDEALAASESAFQRLQSAIRSAEIGMPQPVDESGSTPDSSPVLQGMSATDIQKQAALFFANFRGAKNTKVSVEEGPEGTKGRYDPETDTVVIFSNNATGAADVARTLRHEIFAHKGLSMYPQAQINRILALVSSAVEHDPRVRKIFELFQDSAYSALNREEQLEEVFAFIAEGLRTGFIPRTYNRIVIAARKALAHFGIGPTTATISDIEEVLQDISDAYRTSMVAGNRFGVKHTYRGVKPMYRLDIASARMQFDKLSTAKAVGWVRSFGRGLKTFAPLVLTGRAQLEAILPIAAMQMDRYIQFKNSDGGFWLNEWQHRVGLTPEQISAGTQELRTFGEDKKITQDMVSPEAWKVRQFLDKFYNQYLKSNMPTMGFVPNYVPQTMDTRAMMGRKDDFVSVLMKHDLDVRRPGARIPRKTAEEIYETLMGNNGGIDHTLDDFAGAVGPGNKYKNKRVLRNPLLINDLKKSGFVYTDEREVIDHYVTVGINRGSWERVFGGYRPVVSAIDKEGDLQRPVVNQLLERAGRQDIIEENMSTDALLERLEREGYIQHVPESRDTGSFHWYSPVSKMHDYRERLSQDKHALQRFDEIIHGMMGFFGDRVSAETKAWTSRIMAYEATTVLALSTLSSQTDWSGPYLRIMQDKGVVEALKAIRSTFKATKSYKEMRALGDAYGVVTQRQSQAALRAMYGAEHTTVGAQKTLDTLFKYNGQEWFTNTTRAFGASIGLHYFKTLAAAGDAQTLSTYGLHPKLVQDWKTAGELSPTTDMMDSDPTQYIAARAIHDALHKFVNESIIRPDATQRPVWANDPRFALLWHLKQFFWSFWTQIMHPSVQSMIKQWGQGNHGEAVMQAAFTGLLLLPLAALGWEIKQLIQYSLFGDDQPSDNLDGFDYTYQLMDRAGIFGPAQLAFDAMGSKSSPEAAAHIAGPAADHLFTLLNGKWDEKVYRSIPLLSQAYGAQHYLSR